jgi:hypothetical protein
MNKVLMQKLQAAADAAAGKWQEGNWWCVQWYWRYEGVQEAADTAASK